MKMKSALVAIAFSVLGFSASLAPAMAAGNIYDTLKADPQFSTLVKIIDATHTRHNYVDGTRTVFAPTNEAFDKIKGGYQDMLGETDRANTQALLMYCIIPGERTPESFKGKTETLTTLQKDKVTIYGAGEVLHFGDAYGADQSGKAIKASNGIIIPVNSLPIPEFSQGNETPVPAPRSYEVPSPAK